MSSCSRTICWLRCVTSASSLASGVRLADVRLVADSFESWDEKTSYPPPCCWPRSVLVKQNRGANFRWGQVQTNSQRECQRLPWCVFASKRGAKTSHAGRGATSKEGPTARGGGPTTWGGGGVGRVPGSSPPKPHRYTRETSGMALKLPPSPTPRIL